METKKTYIVTVKTSDTHELCGMETFYCEMMAIDYIENELDGDYSYGECGCYEYYINNERYV